MDTDEIEDVPPDFLQMRARQKSERRQAPPRKVGGNVPDSNKPVVLSWEQVEEDLTQTYVMIAEIWGFKDPECAKILELQAPKMAAAWIAKGQQSPRVAKFLQGITGGSGWIAILAAHSPLILAVLTHHVLMPKIGQAFNGNDNGSGFGNLFPFTTADFGGFATETSESPVDS